MEYDTVPRHLYEALKKQYDELREHYIKVQKVFLLEGDQHGTYYRVLRVTRIQPDFDGLIIWTE